MLEIFSDIKFWNEQTPYDLWVEDGILIKKLPVKAEKHPEGAKVYTCSGQSVLASGVDVQVHLRTPGQSEKETPETGLTAALYGGYGAVLSMPNTKPTLDHPEILEDAYAQTSAASQKTGIAAYYSSCVSKGLEGKELVDFFAMADAGARAFTDDGKGIEPDEFMRAALRASAETDLPVLQHAEWSGHGGVLADCVLSRRLGLKAYDRRQEWSFVERDLKLLREVSGARYHVLHVTTRESLNFIRRAKDRGLNVTAEVSPHHLFFCADDIDSKNTSFKMNPPLHQDEDREALRSALNEGLLDFVATDHAPHEEKAKGSEFAKAAFGTVGLESSLRVLLTGIEEGWLKAERLEEIFSTRPAAFLGLDSEFGILRVGRAFRAVFVDSSEESKFEVKDLKSLSKNSCFLGVNLRGKICAHYSRSGYHGF